MVGAGGEREERRPLLAGPAQQISLIFRRKDEEDEELLQEPNRDGMKGGN